MLNFAALRAPTGNGETLIEPRIEQLGRLVESNRQRVSGHSFRILDRSAEDVRRATRSALGVSPDAPVVAAGHQPEWLHAGVWAKQIMVARIAQAVDAQSLNLIVDNDAPKSTAVTIPTRRNGVVGTRVLHLPGLLAGFAFEHRPPMQVAELATLRNDVAEALGEAHIQASGMPAFFEAAGAATGDWVDQFVAGRRAVESPFSVELDEHRVSAHWPNALVALILVDAQRFASCYNQAIDAYRRENRVRSPNRPIPHLARIGDVTEVPLWVYNRDEPRRRLFVRSTTSGLDLLADRPGGDSIGQINSRNLTSADDVLRALSAMGPRAVRPRALTLTLWARLFAADLFVHGIGGALYDRITDDLMHRYFGVQAPAMACVSATLRLPLPGADVGVDDVRRARHRLRDVHYNPQRYVESGNGVDDLLARRETCIERSRRLRESEADNHRARADVFRCIRSINSSLIERVPALLDELAHDVKRVESARHAARAAGSREYFIGLFPASDLARLCDALPSVEALRTAIPCASKE